MSEMDTDRYVLLLERTAEICFDGILPEREHDTVFIGAIMSVLRVTTLENQPQSVIDRINCELVAALDCLRRTREARWKN
jgi:hypothetical protein